MTVKFTTVESSFSTATKPIYIGYPQHVAIYSKNETYKKLADKLGFKASAISAAFKALCRVLKNNAELANNTKMDGIMSVRNACTGSFLTMQGPWVKGTNTLVINSVTLDPFRATFDGVIPVNNTEGAKPIINSVYDEVTKVYDVITGTDLISIAGSNLAVDTTKTDEGVWLKNSAGTETKLTVSSSDIQVVKAALSTALTAGEYTLIVRTRAGMGSEYGVAEATRKVTVA